MSHFILLVKHLIIWVRRAYIQSFNATCDSYPPPMSINPLSRQEIKYIWTNALVNCIFIWQALKFIDLFIKIILFDLNTRWIQTISLIRKYLLNYLKLSNRNYICLSSHMCAFTQCLNSFIISISWHVATTSQDMMYITWFTHFGFKISTKNGV